MIKVIFISTIALIGALDVLLILGCAKLESEREEYDRLNELRDATDRYKAKIERMCKDDENN